MFFRLWLYLSKLCALFVQILLFCLSVFFSVAKEASLFPSATDLLLFIHLLKLFILLLFHSLILGGGSLPTLSLASFFSFHTINFLSSMEKSSSFLLLPSLLLLLANFHGEFASVACTKDGSEHWGYVQVRPKAHMFWWLYRSPQRIDTPSNPWPLILWLQGGPGGSGVGIGNFQEIGPLDMDLKPRNSTWLQKADLLFVDNPVGTGFSFVEDERLVVKTDEEAATDLTKLLKDLFNEIPSLQKSPFFIVAESYGGKFAVTLALSILKAVHGGELKLNLGGVALGDSWISPEDFVFSWGPLLKDISRLDENGVSGSTSLAQKIKQEIERGKYQDATRSWMDLEGFVSSHSNFVDFYNFLLDAGSDPVSMLSIALSAGMVMKKYSSYLSLKYSSNGDLSSLMNGVIREKLKIIPKNVSWGGQSELVFAGLENDFMKPRIKEVDDLLSKGVNVTVYNGQLDVICATKGTEAWVQKLKWEGLTNFTSLDRTPLFCDSKYETKGFVKSYKNLHFYWILQAGHFIHHITVDPTLIISTMERSRGQRAYLVCEDTQRLQFVLFTNCIYCCQLYASPSNSAGTCGSALYNFEDGE